MQFLTQAVDVRIEIKEAIRTVLDQIAFWSLFGPNAPANPVRSFEYQDLQSGLHERVRRRQTGNAGSDNNYAVKLLHDGAPRPPTQRGPSYQQEGLKLKN
jgi:hypothetical protein